jgi:molybdopterin-synthase adenylyltransferase
MNFDYTEFTTRNLGFITPEEQEKLKTSCVFIPGVGGMGGTALEVLVRSGIENFIISDPDVFEVSNLNRQVFSTFSNVGQSKAESAKKRILDINPNVNVRIEQADWTEKLDEILPQVDLVINGCDDHRATVMLMRKAKQHGKTAIDAFASTLPSVYVVRPQDPRPEDFMNYPTRGMDPKALSLDDWKNCAQSETLYVLGNSSTIKHVVMKFAAEMIQGKRKRMSIASMVWTTGLLMSYEALKVLLAKEKLVSCYGIFLNPWENRFERPWPQFIQPVIRFFVARELKKLK